MSAVGLLATFRKSAALTDRFHGLAEAELLPAAISAASRSPEAHTEVTLGLLYTALTDHRRARTAVELLGSVVRDNYRSASSGLATLTGTKYARLLPKCRRQLVWLAGQLVGLEAQGADKVCPGQKELGFRGGSFPPDLGTAPA